MSIVSEYRFGFQKQEKDDEIYGKGNAYYFKFREHDARIGRFWSVDPLAAKYPYWTPYQFSGNRVIDMMELESAEPKEAGKEIGEQREAHNKDKKIKVINYGDGMENNGDMLCKANHQTRRCLLQAKKC